MTELPESDSKRRATQVGTIFLRGLSGVAGLAAILAGTVLPVLFAVSADEAWELIPALGFIAFCGFVAFWLIRFAVKGPKSSCVLSFPLSFPLPRSFFSVLSAPSVLKIPFTHS